MRSLVFASLLAASSLFAQLPLVRTPADQVPHGVEIPLWSGAAPGAKGETAADMPHLEFFGASPDGRLADGLRTAVIVCPGGGYNSLAYDKEGLRVAEWLNLQGVSAFILSYRLAPRYPYPTPILDGERAVRWVRAHAQEYGVASTRVGVWGVSAGGHMAGIIATHSDAGHAEATDPVDRVSDHPDFLILSYGRLMIDPKVDLPTSMKTLLGDQLSPALIDAISPEQHVTKETPPTFLYATQADERVPVLTSVAFYEALTRAGVPAELHLFEPGPHGTGLGLGYPTLAIYPTLLANWMRLHGWLPPLK
jgi:acetyl esterase/lipase